jgi:hypothetical protein
MVTEYLEKCLTFFYGWAFWTEDNLLADAENLLTGNSFSLQKPVNLIAC